MIVKDIAAAIELNKLIERLLKFEKKPPLDRYCVKALNKLSVALVGIDKEIELDKAIKYVTMITEKDLLFVVEQLKQSLLAIAKDLVSLDATVKELENQELEIKKEQFSKVIEKVSDELKDKENNLAAFKTDNKPTSQIYYLADNNPGFFKRLYFFFFVSQASIVEAGRTVRLFDSNVRNLQNEVKSTEKRLGDWRRKANECATAIVEQERLSTKLSQLKLNQPVLQNLVTELQKPTDRLLAGAREELKKALSEEAETESSSDDEEGIFKFEF